MTLTRSRSWFPIMSRQWTLPLTRTSTYFVFHPVFFIRVILMLGRHTCPGPLSLRLPFHMNIIQFAYISYSNRDERTNNSWKAGYLVTHTPRMPQVNGPLKQMKALPTLKEKENSPAEITHYGGYVKEKRKFQLI